MRDRFLACLVQWSPTRHGLPTCRGLTGRDPRGPYESRRVLFLLCVPLMCPRRRAGRSGYPPVTSPPSHLVRSKSPYRLLQDPGEHGFLSSDRARRSVLHLRAFEGPSEDLRAPPGAAVQHVVIRVNSEPESEIRCQPPEGGWHSVHSRGAGRRPVL